MSTRGRGAILEIFPPIGGGSCGGGGGSGFL